MIKKQFGFDVPVFVISKEELDTLLHNAPDWWGNDDKEIYDNLIFILPPITFHEVFREIGEPKEAFEKIEPYKNAVFCLSAEKIIKRQTGGKDGKRIRQPQIDDKNGKHCQKSF